MSKPDYYHWYCELALVCVSGFLCWPCYCLRPRDYFADMRKAFKEARERFLE